MKNFFFEKLFSKGEDIKIDRENFFDKTVLFFKFCFSYSMCRFLSFLFLEKYFFSFRSFRFAPRRACFLNCRVNEQNTIVQEKQNGVYNACNRGRITFGQYV